MSLYQKDDTEKAIAFQVKAIIVSERVFGLDDPETARLYVLIFSFFQKKKKKTNLIGI